MCDRGDSAAASALQKRILSPNAAVTKLFGVPGLKRAMDWTGYYGGPARRPLMPLNKEQEGALRRSFQDNDFL